MRAIRIFFIFVLAVALILVALANREAATVSLIPARLAQITGGQLSVTMPLFMVLFLTLAIGVLIGLFWEWLRESHLRAQSKARAKDLAKLEREVGDLRTTHSSPRDDVLAILDDAKPAQPSSGSAVAVGAASGQLPVAR